MQEIPYRISVQEIGDSPHYKNIVAKVESLSPIVPAYDHKGGTNIETIKFELARREMHSLVLKVLRGDNA